MCKIPKLFELMTQRNINAKKLSEATGISTGNISDWKSGRSSPSCEKVVLISNFFNVSSDYLLGLDTEPNRKAPLSEDKQRLLEMYDMLTDMEKGEILGELKVLTHSKYIAVPVAARDTDNSTPTKPNLDDLDSLPTMDEE